MCLLDHYVQFRALVGLERPLCEGAVEVLMVDAREYGMLNFIEVFGVRIQDWQWK